MLDLFIHSVNTMYRSYDVLATSAGQFWHYLQPWRALGRCLYLDCINLVLCWLSNIDYDQLLAVQLVQPWFEGYVCHPLQDLEFVLWYSYQWGQFLTEDWLQAIREMIDRVVLMVNIFGEL